tara:strand:+ start:16789 stop:17004 length:216 start_codon:yes stop_codon:yes gene_type:complete
MWGLKDQWNYHINKKTPVFITENRDGEWIIQVQENFLEEVQTFILDVAYSEKEAIDFCNDNKLKYELMRAQ